MTDLITPFTLLVIVSTTVWVALAVHYRFRRLWVRVLVSLVPLVFVGASLRLLPLFPWALTVWLTLFVVALAWWLTLTPRSDRDWACGLDVLPRIERNGDILQVRQFRNFSYTAAGDPVPRYEDRTFDLARLKSLDYFLAHWSGQFMAHTLVSFGFDDGKYLAISVEARRRRWQRYSPLWGLFRSYELFFVLGDEHDIVRLRTTVRRERVYRYRVPMTPEKLRRLIEDYLGRAQRLAARPEWYNSVTSNCTTNLFYHRLDQIPWWLMPGIFLNGLSGRIMYRLGFLARDLPFKELQARSEIRDRFPAADDDADFSRRIRGDTVPDSGSGR
jgi:hypothetical protein